jgi:aryl-alcohol dehydrogenase-like predicted oxidoreductase
MLEKMIIGTVQFGLDYGVNSVSAKKLTQQDCDNILDVATVNGIMLLDTAEAYGDAIEKIAYYHQNKKGFEIISKFLSPDDIIGPLTDSLKRMSIDRYHTVLAHKSQDLFFNSNVQRDLMQLKDSGLTKYIGVSIYTNDEFQQSIENKYVDVIQFPFNLLDNINQRGALMKQAKDAGKILHARSAYLQGMLLKEFPLSPKLKPLEVYLQKLKELCLENKITMTSLCLEYTFSNNLIDNVIIGQHKGEQLLDNIGMIRNFKKGVYLKEVDNINVRECELLNPRNW